MTVGAVVGFAIGRAGALAHRPASSPRARACIPAFTIGVACLSFGVASVIHGSGFLSVYVAGVTLGSGSMPYRAAVRRVHDALGWLAQIVMFLLLGLLVFPTPARRGGGPGTRGRASCWRSSRVRWSSRCVSRRFEYPLPEIVYVGWVGLRGAVPIVLATIPVMSGAPGAPVLFDVVFFIIVVRLAPSGSDGRFVTRWLKLQSARTVAPTTVVPFDGAADGHRASPVLHRGRSWRSPARPSRRCPCRSARRSR